MVIGRSVRTALLSTDDRPGVSWRKHCSLRQVCLCLILAILTKAKECHWLLHVKHFLSAFLSSWAAYLAASPHSVWAHPQRRFLTLMPLQFCTYLLTHHSQALSFKTKWAKWDSGHFGSKSFECVFTPLQKAVLISEHWRIRLEHLNPTMYS